MKTRQIVQKIGVLSLGLLALLVSGCGGGADGPAIQARAQTINFGVAPAMTLVTVAGIASGATRVVATASSGLPVVYSSVTQDVCTVDKSTGVVTVNGRVTVNTTKGCRIAADQYGNDTFAPVRQVQLIAIALDPSQTIAFTATPGLSLFSTVTVSAAASSGLTVTYASATPAVCSVDSQTGLVTDLTAGTCTVTANQAGNANYNTAPQVIQSLVVSIPASVTVPGAPTGVTATLGTVANTVKVSMGATVSGGSPITGYTVTSTPAGLSATGTASPITLACGANCNGYAFSVTATNAVGTSPPSALTDVLTGYDVVATFREPATQPNDSIFTGTFTINATTGSVINLAGSLTQSMTGGSSSLAGGASATGGHYGDVPMTLVALSHQLSTLPATLGGVNGLLVTTFALSTTNTFFILSGGDGWSPDAGVDVGGVYFGFPTAPNPSAGGVGNAYTRIFVNPANPTVALTQAQIDKLAYADCTSGGMMGAVCMTGTTTAGYGDLGTMGGYPVSQTITRRP